ncbi:hypothetical protein G4B88_029013 [Cannabis sativa]|uniref:Uncharacterized protein n=1 Tax=Cannabis sativa TaxID=3483 RepID=A0A7J6HPN8_CANSA|nr:hypothetical protein G4B88_029013 [Cannabis sativa]
MMLSDVWTKLLNDFGWFKNFDNLADMKQNNVSCFVGYFGVWSRVGPLPKLHEPLKLWPQKSKPHFFSLFTFFYSSVLVSNQGALIIIAVVWLQTMSSSCSVSTPLRIELFNSIGSSKRLIISPSRTACAPPVQRRFGNGRFASKAHLLFLFDYVAFQMKIIDVTKEFPAIIKEILIFKHSLFELVILNYSLILLEDTKEYISYAPKEETKAQDKRPFDLLVIISPKLQKKSNSRSSPLIEGSVEVQITLLNFSVIRSSWIFLVRLINITKQF